MFHMQHKQRTASPHLTRHKNGSQAKDNNVQTSSISHVGFKYSASHFLTTSHQQLKKYNITAEISLF
ncbi:hypothetical protein NC652_016265 [Populus alba x Populus x berolinensis]|nr:hypothetical protein NC652_016265 [Populus alba x Populus x berolinensis]